MLQSIRDRAQGWIAWFIVTLISVPFALWGIQEYLGAGSEPAIATVNATEITEREFEGRYREYKQQLRQRLGDAYRPDLFDEEILRNEALESMIRSELIVQKSSELGMRASDAMVRAAIADISAFQVEGRFMKAAYERTLSSQGMTQQSFEERMYRALMSEQLQAVVSESNWVTEEELAEAVRLRRQQRSYEYLVIPAADYLEQAEITDAEVQEYYAANPDRFVSPEQVKLDYIELDQDSIVGTLKASEEDLQAYYEQNRKNYISPERRKASHILFLAEEGADAAQLEAAEKSARDVLQRINNGEDFAELAKKLSQDPGSAKQGGDLGFFGTGVMDPAFEEAVFGLADEGAVSEPVRSSFGFHVIQLTGIEPEAGKSFEEAREEVTEAHLKAEAARVLYEYAERLAGLVYEDPDTLAPASEALGVEVKKSDWIAREGAPGIFSNPKVSGAAFSDDVLHQGNNSEMIELSPEHMVVLRVEDHKESSIKPLEEVKESIVATLKAEKAAAKASETGAEYLVKLKGGELSLQAIAEELGKQVVVQADAQRNGSAPREVAAAAFRLPGPVEDSLVNGDVVMGNGDFALISLSKVVDGDVSTLSDEEKSQLRTSLGRSAGRADYQHFLKNLRDQAKVVIKLPKSDG